MLRITASGICHFYANENLEKRWNMFDSFVVGLSIVETLIERCFGDTWQLTNLPILRLLRLMRVIRLVRVVRFLKDLRIMIMSIASSIMPLFWASCLIFMLMYAFAVYILDTIGVEQKGY